MFNNKNAMLVIAAGLFAVGCVAYSAMQFNQEQRDGEALLKARAHFTPLDPSVGRYPTR